MFRWIRLSILLMMLFFLGNPVAIQATNLAANTAAAPRLVVFEGFFST